MNETEPERPREHVPRPKAAPQGGAPGGWRGKFNSKRGGKESPPRAVTRGGLPPGRPQEHGGGPTQSRRARACPSRPAGRRSGRTRTARRPTAGDPRKPDGGRGEGRSPARARAHTAQCAGAEPRKRASTARRGIPRPRAARPEGGGGPPGSSTFRFVARAVGWFCLPIRAPLVKAGCGGAKRTRPQRHADGPGAIAQTFDTGRLRPAPPPRRGGRGEGRSPRRAGLPRNLSDGSRRKKTGPPKGPQRDCSRPARIKTADQRRGPPPARETGRTATTPDGRRREHGDGRTKSGGPPRTTEDRDGKDNGTRGTPPKQATGAGEAATSAHPVKQASATPLAERSEGPRRGRACAACYTGGSWRRPGLPPAPIPAGARRDPQEARGPGGRARPPNSRPERAKRAEAFPRFDTEPGTVRAEPDRAVVGGD